MLEYVKVKESPEQIKRYIEKARQMLTCFIKYESGACSLKPDAPVLLQKVTKDFSPWDLHFLYKATEWISNIKNYDNPSANNKPMGIYQEYLNYFFMEDDYTEVMFKIMDIAVEQEIVQDFNEQTDPLLIYSTIVQAFAYFAYWLIGMVYLGQFSWFVAMFLGNVAHISDTGLGVECTIQTSDGERFHVI